MESPKSEPKRFVYLKLGFGNRLAKYCLSNNNVFGEPFAVIFFNPLTTEQCEEFLEARKKGKDELKRTEKKYGREVSERELDQIETFFKAWSPDESERKMFVTIVGDQVYLYEPKEKVFDMSKDDQNNFYKYIQDEHKDIYDRVKNDLPKCTRVKIIKKVEKESVPFILLTLPCNQKYNRVTCKKIDDEAVNNAIKHILDPDFRPSIKSAKDIISHLSPHELETLVFLILKNAGLFVPAWRGGTIKDYDIIAYNKNPKDIKLGQIVIKAGESKTFQVKREVVEKPSDGADYTITLDAPSSISVQRVLTSEWLLDQINEKGQEETKKWLIESLKWTGINENTISQLKIG